MTSFPRWITFSRSYLRVPNSEATVGLVELPDGIAHRKIDRSVITGRATGTFYRPELDVVRMLAFFSVFGHHTIVRDPLRHSRFLIAIADSLGFGLCLFFTLSAYLITSLLLREKAQRGSIDLRRFYARRILRIWPLYFLALLLGVVFAIEVGQWHNQERWFFAALLMCGNLVSFSGPLVGHLWSISLEEQFYVFFPSVIRYANFKVIAIIAVGIILLANATLIYFGLVRAPIDAKVWPNTFVQFEMFAGGVLLALFEGRRKTFGRLTSAAMLLAVPLVWFAAVFSFDARSHTAGPGKLCIGYGIVAFSCVLVLVAAAGIPRWPASFVYLGKISYGLYVFHIPILLLAHRYFEGYIPHLLIAPICLLLTVLSAALSYRYFETFFLRVKYRLEMVHSRPV